MLVRFVLFLISLSSRLKENLWKGWYQMLSAAYKKKDFRFMNYGYATDLELSQPKLKNETDEENRLFIQLYEHVLEGIDLTGKEVLEIGCGRGGGADYVARYKDPASVVGVDISKNAVTLCNQFHQVPNLRFVEGRADRLPFEKESFDVVYNIESSHCYGDMNAFIAEVIRVLKPGGIFAWADLRPSQLMVKDEAIFLNSSLQLVSKEQITRNVSRALDQISNRKKEMIQKTVPRLFQTLFCEFMGVRDSQIYRKFQENTVEYWCYQFQKPQ